MDEQERWQRYVDKIIQEAMERGEFDYSRLKGKRLAEDSTEVFAGDRAMAHKLLKNSGYAPDFLMKKREIDERLEKERGQLLRYALRRRQLLAAAEAEQEPQRTHLRERAEEEWAWALRRFDAAIPQINEQISIFNLMNKIPNLHKLKIRLERELERLAKQLEAG